MVYSPLLAGRTNYFYAFSRVPKAMAGKRTILIVDDDAELREALVEQLALHEEFEASAV